MSQSLVNILVHIVFSTKHREPLILPRIEAGLYSYINGIVRGNDSTLIMGNGVEDHIHLLVSLGKTVDVSTLIGAIKRSSTRWVKVECGVDNFKWQAGYGAFSVSQSQSDGVKRYIANQKVHHKTQSFQDEFRSLLRKHNVEFDERYVWD